ncbi:serine/threonine-protein kinase 17A-like, partial [Paramacrobiotus metropolitanus]|uniref:serine/threonine-protein kinase 17A-like n=1 Tax=Paramacrobiotus metropolitanus TaxID=2943436 RepID=UPI0024461B2A
HDGAVRREDPASGTSRHRAARDKLGAVAATGASQSSPVLPCGNVHQHRKGRGHYGVLLAWESGAVFDPPPPEPRPPGPAPKALRGCTRDILLGLHHLHTQRIVHTDLKPSNILLAPSEGGGVVLKLADMDDHVGILSSVTGSEIRTTRGTVRYMAPEMFRLAAQWDVEERIGRKLDVWSAGVVVVEMARGVRPLRLIKMDKGRPVETDWLEVTADTRAYAIMDFMLNHGVPVVLDGVLRGFAGLPRCFREIGADRPTAEELLRDPWLADESDGDTGQWWLGDEEL